MVLTFKRSLENVESSAILYRETITVYCQVLLNSCLFNKPLNEWILKYMYICMCLTVVAMDLNKMLHSGSWLQILN